MRAAIARFLEGFPARLPFEARVHMIAARYGQTPASVREWPAADFRFAEQYLALTTPRILVGRSDRGR